MSKLSATGSFSTPVDLSEYTLVHANERQQEAAAHAAFVPWHRGLSFEVCSFPSSYSLTD